MDDPKCISKSKKIRDSSTIKNLFLPMLVFFPKPKKNNKKIKSKYGKVVSNLSV